MPKVLVTGATGFAGSHLAKRLLSEGYEVRTLVRSSADASYLEDLGAEIFTGDMLDHESVRRAVSGVDTVYHIAAIFRKAGLPDSMYWAVNYEGTINLMKACLDEGVRRVVHCSTVGVLGHIENPPANEDFPYNPGDIYQRTKCAAEKEILALHKDHGLPVSIIRPAGIYGPSDTRWLKLFRMVAHRKFAMLGSGNTFIHLVYISDLVDAFILAAQSPNAVGRVYIAAGERYITLNNLVQTIARATSVTVPKVHIPVAPVHFLSGICEDVCKTIHVEPPIFRRRVDFFIKDRAFDITRARTEIGYSPRIDVDEGVSRTVAWYSEQGLL